MRIKVAIILAASLVTSLPVAQSADQSPPDIIQRPLDRLRQIFGNSVDNNTASQSDARPQTPAPRTAVRAPVTTARPQMSTRRSSPRTASRSGQGIFSRPRTSPASAAPEVQENTRSESAEGDTTSADETQDLAASAPIAPTVTLARQSATLGTVEAGASETSEEVAPSSYESLIRPAARPVTPREVATLKSQSHIVRVETSEAPSASLVSAMPLAVQPVATTAKPQTTLVSAEPAVVPPTALPSQPAAPSRLLTSETDQPEKPFEVGLSPTPRLIPASPAAPADIAPPLEAVTATPAAQPRMRTTTIMPPSASPVIVPAAPPVQPTQIVEAAPPQPAAPPVQIPAAPLAPVAAPEIVHAPAPATNNVVAAPPSHTPGALRRVDAPRPAPIAIAKLTATMIGPKEIYFGDTGIFKVLLVNEGSAPAKDVRVEVLANDALIKTLNVGTIPAKTDVTVEIALAPNQMGSMELRASASAADNVKAVAGSVVFVGKPQLSLAIAGPPQMNFGDLKLYTAILNNTGNADATNVSVLVMLQGEQAQSLPVGIVPAGQTRQVRFELRPEQAGQLSVNAVASADGNVQAVANGAIHVLQHEVQLALEGPRQLLYGDKAVYTLVVSNKGNSDAENVIVNVTLGESVLDRLFEGTLTPGKEEKISFEVSPSKPGFHALRAVALGAGDLKAATTAKLQVKHGQLEVAVDSPSVKFAGAEATYTVRVKNIGDADANDVLVTAHLPESIRFLSGVDRIEFYEGITWRVGKLPPGQEQTYLLNCELSAAGEQKIVFNATGAEDLEASQTVTTAVEALADVRLFVADPQGLVPVGQDVVYEIEIHNRGVKAARNVEVVMQLSDALEAIHVEGADAQTTERGVVFDPIATMAAKETVKLRVTARAKAKGSHQFRVEMTADEPQTFMASEGTTRFYGNTIEPVASP